MAARSASVALATAGDVSHLHDFVAASTGTAAQLANLNYWGYWTGEISADHVNDEFMARDDPASWSGTRMLLHLGQRLDPTSPQLALNLQTVHGLVAARPALLTGWPHLRLALADALERIASTDALTRAGHRQVADLHYALRLADR
jgi:hypothetical protein